MSHSDNHCLYHEDCKLFSTKQLKGYRIAHGGCNALPLQFTLAYLRDRFVRMCRHIQRELADEDGNYPKGSLVDAAVWGDRIACEIVGHSYSM